MDGVERQYKWPIDSARTCLEKKPTPCMTQIYIQFTHLEKKDVGYVRSPECNQDWYCWWRSSGSALVFAKSISYGQPRKRKRSARQPKHPLLHTQPTRKCFGQADCLYCKLRLRVDIIVHARIRYLCKYRTCMV